MKPRTLFSQILRIFFVAMAIVLVAVAIIAGIGWWAGWQTEAGFRSAILIAGLILIGIGFLGIKGNSDLTSGVEYQKSMSVSKDNSWKRTQQSITDFTQNFSFLLIMFFAGAICMVIGWLM